MVEHWRGIAICVLVCGCAGTDGGTAPELSTEGEATEAPADDDHHAETTEGNDPSADPTGGEETTAATSATSGGTDATGSDTDDTGLPEPGVIEFELCTVPDAVAGGDTGRRYFEQAISSDGGFVVLAYELEASATFYLVRLGLDPATSCAFQADFDALPLPSEPYDVAVDSEDRIWITLGNGPVRVWPEEDALDCGLPEYAVGTIVAGDEGSTLFSTAMTDEGVDRWSVGPSGCTLEPSWGSYVGDSELGLAVDPQGQVHVMTTSVPRVQLFDGGTHVTTYGAEMGDEALSFTGRHGITPRSHGVAVYSDGDLFRYGTDGALFDTTDLDDGVAGRVMHVVSNRLGDAYAFVDPPVDIDDPDPGPLFTVWRLRGM